METPAGLKAWGHTPRQRKDTDPMPKLSLSADEAKALKARRARNKAWNVPLMAAVEKIKKRLKKSDALEAATVQACLNDLRKMLR